MKYFMENETFERNYSKNTTDKLTAMELKENEIFDYIAKSGVLKNYSDFVQSMPKCIIPEDKEAYEDLLSRLDVYAKRKHGKIKGIVDYIEGVSIFMLNFHSLKFVNPKI